MGTDPTHEGRGRRSALWAQLVELEQRGATDQLAKAAVIREICDTSQLSLRGFAQQAAQVHGLDGLSAQPVVSRLLAWAELVEAAHDLRVIPAGITPAERTLRPLFAKHVPADQRLDVLTAALTDDGTVTAASVKAAVADFRYPTDDPVTRREVHVLSPDQGIALLRREWKRRTGKQITNPALARHLALWLLELGYDTDTITNPRTGKPLLGTSQKRRK